MDISKDLWFCPFIILFKNVVKSTQYNVRFWCEFFHGSGSKVTTISPFGSAPTGIPFGTIHSHPQITPQATISPNSARPRQGSLLGQSFPHLKQPAGLPICLLIRPDGAWWKEPLRCLSPEISSFEWCKPCRQRVTRALEYLFKCVLIFFLTFLATQKALQAQSTATAPPNILIITVDNVGYGDFSFYNEDSPILTPHLEKLASQGVRLTNFYTASPTCTVSRASLLTGRLPQRHKTTRQLVGIPGNYGIGLRQSEILLPEILKNLYAQYATGAFGKWNIGFAPGSRPTERGFDEYLGIASGNADHFTHVYAGKKDLYHNTESINREGEYSTDLFANAAIDFIEKNTGKDHPWFVYLPFDAPHHPGDRNIGPDSENIWKAPDYAFEPYGLSADEKDPKKRFNAVVTAVDMAIGRVMNKLDELGIAENTFVFFYSDNGAFYPYINSGIQSNAPLKGAGVTLWEGGIRVPALVRWPGKIPEGEELDTRLWSLDLFPTCAKLAGTTLPRDRFIDGKNMVPNLVDGNPHSPHETLYFEYIDFDALLWGNWKVIRESEEEDWQLYNLEKDISELHNEASDRKDLVDKLSAVFDQKKAEVEHYLKIENQFQNE